ncbi:hypothetical protein HNR42_001651 [Deinobacterium chartae]|uniref:Uncharacterized protein n=1 Tax=Deinobacterium chartae TaxID=521158 RepID=A0A841HZC9_9DEIO|nr:hypothetical protein [Deinobacterium chartae]MBB6098226.1 hypothetical protein [Deinobacterium chartae]
MFKALRSLGRRPQPRQVQAALWEVYTAAFALPVLPALLIGALLGGQHRLSWHVVLTLLACALPLMGVAFYLAGRTYARKPSAASALGAAAQLAVMPAIPLLFAVLTLHEPLKFAALAALAVITFPLAGGLFVMWSGPYPEAASPEATPDEKREPGAT